MKHPSNADIVGFILLASLMLEKICQRVVLSRTLLKRRLPSFIARALGTLFGGTALFRCFDGRPEGIHPRNPNDATKQCGREPKEARSKNGCLVGYLSHQHGAILRPYEAKGEAEGEQSPQALPVVTLGSNPGEQRAKMLTQFKGALKSIRARFSSRPRKLAEGRT